MGTTGKHQNNYLKSLGARIKCELNDLKRTTESASRDLGLDIKFIESIINGLADSQSYDKFIKRMGQVYPIDTSYLTLIKKDTENGIKYMSIEDSDLTTRVYERTDGHGETSQYYRYKDTAMSNLSLFKPEWIEVLKEVDDSDPKNLRVVMNNGHFMHQTTLFIGPVNFYYEDENGNLICEEMNTGDSNYITPFVKHSFASRDKNSFTCILAVTYGGDISRAQSELHALGENKLKSFLIIDLHVKNAMISMDILNKLVFDVDPTVDLKSLIQDDKVPKISELQVIASCLNTSVSSLIPEIDTPDKCVIQRFSKSKYCYYPSNTQRSYKIFSLANDKTSNLMKNCLIKVLSSNHDHNNCFQRSFHTYIINYGSSSVEIQWTHDDNTHLKILNKYDSMYLEPFTKFSFANLSEDESDLFIVGIKSSITLEAQKELSKFLKPERVINQLETWYGKK